MANLVQGTFSADGSTVTAVAKKFTILAGSDGGTGYGTNFGGGTLNVECSHDGTRFTTVDSFTAEGAKTSIEYVGGCVLKLTLTGSTSPDLFYSIKYEG